MQHWNLSHLSWNGNVNGHFILPFFFIKPCITCSTMQHEALSEVQEALQLLHLEQDNVLALHKGLISLDQAGLLPTHLFSLQDKLVMIMHDKQENNRENEFLCIKCCQPINVSPSNSHAWSWHSNAAYLTPSCSVTPAASASTSSASSQVRAWLVTLSHVYPILLPLVDDDGVFSFSLCVFYQCVPKWLVSKILLAKMVKCACCAFLPAK